MPNSTFNTQHSTFLVPTKTIKSPNFTLRNKEKKRMCVYRHPSLFNHIQDNIKKRKNGKQKQKQSNQPAAAPTA